MPSSLNAMALAVDAADSIVAADSLETMLAQHAGRSGGGRWRLAKMRTSIGIRKRPQSALIECQFIRKANGHVCLGELAYLLTIPRNAHIDHARALSISGQES
jgi:hypothetical protein